MNQVTILIKSEYQSLVSAIVRIGGRSSSIQSAEINATKRTVPVNEKANPNLRSDIDCQGERTITILTIQRIIAVNDM